MIRFFRTIRQSLINEGKTQKYLKYAIGEIVLVVIGILIALQINNWNETRKAGLKERQLLDNLQIEFTDNLAELDSVSKNVNTVIASLETVFECFGKTEAHLNISLDSLLSAALDSPSWRPSEYLLNNLSSSGSIADLKNERLKLLLYKWSRLQHEMHEIDVKTEETGDEIITYLKQHGSLRNVDVTNKNFNYRTSLLTSDNSALFSDPEFENHVDDKLYMYVSTRTVLGEARSLLLRLIEETKDH